MHSNLEIFYPFNITKDKPDILRHHFDRIIASKLGDRRKLVSYACICEVYSKDGESYMRSVCYIEHPAGYEVFGPTGAIASELVANQTSWIASSPLSIHRLFASFFLFSQGAYHVMFVDIVSVSASLSRPPAPPIAFGPTSNP